MLHLMRGIIYPVFEITFSKCALISPAKETDEVFRNSSLMLGENCKCFKWKRKLKELCYANFIFVNKYIVIG